MNNRLLKKGSLLVALTMCLAFTQTMNAQYCVPEGTEPGRHINNFTTTTGAANIENLASGFSVAGYGDFFDTQTASQSLEQSIDFSVDVVGGTAGFRIWIDWNQDEVFDATTEVAYSSSAYSANHTGSFDVPADALEGETRMRIVSHWLSNSGDVDPCVTGFTYGEFEDYKFEVIYPSDCTGTPDAGISFVNPAAGNPGSMYNVTAQGYTVATAMSFQWQSNTDGAGWVDEGTATATHSSFAATAPIDLGVEVEWRLALTCTASSETSFSDVATFTTVISYCDADSDTIEAITRIIFAGIDNASPVASTDAYEDFTAIIAEVEVDGTYSFTAEGDTNGDFTNFFSTWVDWNNNGEFEATEYYEIGSIDNSDGTDGQQATLDIVIPSDAVIGETRMRVRKNFNAASTNPCGSNTYGQVEDYTVNVVAGAVFPSPYCEIEDAADVTVEEITSVEFAATTITNDDITSVLVDKTDIIVTVTAAEIYTLVIEGNTMGDFENNIVAFIDWNQNEILDDAGEIYELGTLENSTGADGVSVSIEITVPVDAVLGQTRARITKTYFDADSPVEINPCGIQFNPFGQGVFAGYGQALDFTVEVEEVVVGGYCEPVLDCTDNDMITNVTFQELDNTTTCSPNGYEDNTSMIATVQSGGTFPISVSVGDGWASESVSVWIDFDGSETFEESEFYYIGTGSDEALTGAISIPASVADGDYRMRVRVAAVGETTATWDMSCDEAQGFGETEDYTLTVDGVAGVNDYVASNLTFYPNPVENVLNISATQVIKTVSAYNLLGQEVMGENRFDNGSVDVSSLPTGTYLFRVTFEGGQIENFKVLKK